VRDLDALGRDFSLLQVVHAFKAGLLRGVALERDEEAGVAVSISTYSGLS